MAYFQLKYVKKTKKQPFSAKQGTPSWCNMRDYLEPKINISEETVI